MKIIETEKFKKLSQFGPRYHNPEKLEGPEAEIAGTDIQGAVNYAFVKAMVGMNLDEFSEFESERINQILEEFKNDLRKGPADPGVAEQHISQAEALRDDPQGLMGFFKHNSPIPGSHSEYLRQEDGKQHLMGRNRIASASNKKG